MNQKQFTKVLASKSDLSVKSARKLVEAFGDSIESALINGERVVYSNFGSFYLVNYPSKTIHHPAFGNKKKTIMLATNAVKWMPSDNIKDLVDHHLEAKSATSFGSTKIIKETKKNAGISERKALEISETEKKEIEKTFRSPAQIMPEDEIVEIPIRVTKSAWVDLPVPSAKNSTVEKELIPFSKNSSQISYLNLVGAKIPDHILCLVPEELARRTKVVPISLKDEILILGMADPNDHETLSMIRKIVRKKISPRLVSENDLDKIFDQYSKLSAPVSMPSVVSAESGAREGPVSRIINLILKRAVRDLATTIHFDPNNRDISVRFRIGGKLIERMTIDKSLEKSVVSRLKSLTKISKKTLSPNRNFFSIDIDGTPEEFELLSIITTDGEKLTIHIKDRLKELEKITELELRETDYVKITSTVARAGLTLVASRSEKERQRVFYALADYLFSEGLDIITLENSPALTLPGINQIDIASENNIDYDTTLTQVSKFDCDVVMIDQLPAGDFANKILSLFTDKIIIAGVNADDSFDALTQIFNRGVTSQALARTLNLVIATASIKKVCKFCKTPEKPGRETVHILREIISHLPFDERSRLRRLGSNFSHGLGCAKCNQTGHLGTISLFETLVSTEKIFDLIVKNSDFELIKKEATRTGFTNLSIDGVIKALIGETTIEEVFRK